MNRVALLAVPLALAAGLITACSSDTTSTDTTATDTAATDTTSTDDATSVGGMAVCDEATLTAAVKDFVASEPESGAFQSLDGFECADGWAVTFPTVGATMDEAYTYTQIFRAEGQFWVPVPPAERGSVCGTYNEDDPTAYPSDSEVPESIWQAACNTN